MKQFEHITAMQKEVLAFARGERSLLLSRIYLYKFFEEFEANVRRELEGRAIAFVLNLEDRGIARFDEGKMTRALHNLVRNAQDAIGDTAGTITVDVKRDKDDLVISVSDTGPGIPKEIEGKLFQSFVTAGKKGGTGLGLAIVKKVVEEHGGQVSVTSSKKGAVFTIRLPQTASAPAHAASSPAPKSNRSS
jgi:signal transduction histidine kinase